VSRSGERPADACAARKAAQQRPRPAADLAQRAQAGLILLTDLAAAAGARQNTDQQRPQRLVKRIDAHQLARIGQGFLWPCAKPLGQGAENLCLQLARVLAQTQQPAVEFAVRRQVEIGQ